MNIKRFIVVTACVLAAIALINNSHGQSMSVIESGENYRVLQKTVQQGGTNRISRVVELGTGLNFKTPSGQWQESSEQIVVLKQGGASATLGNHKAYFPADIFNGVLEVVTPDGKHLKSRPLGVSLDDGSQSVWIGTLKHSIGYLTSSNVVTYFDAFEGIKADIVATYRRGGFECDVVFRENPKSPEAYGLSAGSTLQMITEFFNTPEPEKILGQYDDWYGLQDSTLKFGGLRMTQGKAFAVPAANGKRNAVAAVYKSWLHIRGRTFLVEQLPLEDIAAELRTLPDTAAFQDPRRQTPDPILHTASTERLLPPSRGIILDTNQMLVASMDLNKQPGVVLDYTEILDSGLTDYEFFGGTYYISSPLNLYGTTTFHGGAVLKLLEYYGGELNIYGTVNNQSDPSHPVVLTSKDDDSIGEVISGSSGYPSLANSTLNTINVWADSIELDNLQFNYASCPFANYNHDSTSTFWNCEFNNCTASGVIGVASGTVILRNVLNASVGFSYPEEWCAVDAQQITSVNQYFIWPSASSVSVVNSIIIGDSGDWQTNTSLDTVATNDFEFVSDSIHNFYYLPMNSPYHDIGTTSIDAGLLSEFAQMTTYAPLDGSYADSDTPDLGYHYAINEDYDYDGLPDRWEILHFGNLGQTDTGDYDSDGLTNLQEYELGTDPANADENSNGINDGWEWKYFGNFSQSATNDYDSDGTNIFTELSNNIDPNKIQFSLSVPNQYVNVNPVPVTLTIFGGVPSSMAVLVDSTNFAGATWSDYDANPSIDLGMDQGWHDIRIGLRGLPSDAQQTWETTRLFLDTVAPSISITNPANNVSFGVSRMNVLGSFTETSLKQITVNGVLAFVGSNSFAALNVPLDAGTNIIIATAEDLAGNIGTNRINIIGVTNAQGILVDPIQLSATPVGGFTPLVVTFTIQTNVPGMAKVLYDFKGDNVIDFITNNLQSLAHTYTNGEYFPVVTIQTTAGYFSSSGGWNSFDPNRLRINVQESPVLLSTISVTDPVDIKWVAPSNLYVLSGSTATITEFSTNGSTVRALSGLGTTPSGFDVDADGNVYVAVTASNQVWKLFPTNGAFALNTNFGIGGIIGYTNGISGTNFGKFNAPFDVAVSPDGLGITVSDSGNHRIQQFSATNGAFIASFGSQGTNIGQFNTPKGLTYDSVGTLYIVDSGNNRIAAALDSAVIAVSGTNGSALGQFNSAVNVSVGKRGVYVADAGNNRIQKFDLAANGAFSITPFNSRLAVSTNFSLPSAVAAVDNVTNEIFYVADTGNNRVVLCKLPDNNPVYLQSTWSNLVTHVATNNLSIAISSFSILSAEKYRQAFIALGTNDLANVISDIGTITPVVIENDTAQYRFDKVIDGVTITFPVEFVKENGVWKILEF